MSWKKTGKYMPESIARNLFLYEKDMKEICGECGYAYGNHYRTECPTHDVGYAPRFPKRVSPKIAMRVKFYNFLTENDAYSAWKRNKKALRNSVMTLTSEPDRWISRSFAWWESPEGHIYWEHLNDKWQEEIKKMK